MSDLRAFFENLVYRGGRFTQHSPVMPDVWVQFGLQPYGPQDLLLVADWHATPEVLARDLRSRLRADRAKKSPALLREPKSPARIAYNQSTVAAELWFEDVIRAALPLSGWWRKYLARPDRDGDQERDETDPATVFENPSLRVELQRELIEKFGETSQSRGGVRMKLPAEGKSKARYVELTADLVWLAQVVGTIAYVAREFREHFKTKQGCHDFYRDHPDQRQVLMAWLKRLEPANEDCPHAAVGRALFELLDGMEAADESTPESLFSINLNRRTEPAVAFSISAIKADAAQNLFKVTGKEIRWAVLDSGIDAGHIAFRKRNRDGKAAEQPFSEGPRGPKDHTRIRATYDFTCIRDLFAAEVREAVVEAKSKAKKREAIARLLPKELVKRLKKLKKLDELGAALEMQHGQVTNWALFEPILRIPHEPGNYEAAEHPHGTHVAGIIGADWRKGDEQDEELVEPSDLDGDADRVTGICPDIELFDLRVLDKKGSGDEFSIMAGLQFVRFLNARHDYVEVHGVNLSFSIKHDVSNYACGRTPVCVESERLVGSGVVVVAAAGNSGRSRYLTPDGFSDEGFRTVSITDPGNAELVITVGSTHRIEPHTYGVSYFSSRGPTGDGRVKPDLVAPGEKIRSTVPGNRDLYLDGTSMAAPHVSGAAALLMSRNYEFISHPDKIKKVLCESATDLGRERYFQGAGLLDILRALQSI